MENWRENKFNKLLEKNKNEGNLRNFQKLKKFSKIMEIKLNKTN